MQIFCGVLLFRLTLWLFYVLQIYRINQLGRSRILQPKVSVIVANKNNAEGLRILIPQILEQQYHEFELIVVDDFSTDDSLVLLEDINHPKFRYIKCSKDIPGKKQALAEAILASKGDWILLTDADCIPASPYWISKMVGCIGTDTELVLGFSPIIENQSDEFQNLEYRMVALFSKMETWLTAVQYLSWARAGLPYMGVGRNMMYKKDFFYKAGGFKQFMHLPSGDDDLLVAHHAKADATEICLDKEAYVYTSPVHSLKDYFHQKTRHIAVSKYYPARAKILNLMFSVSLILFYLLFVAGVIFTDYQRLLWADLFGFYLLLIGLTILIQKKLSGFFNCWWIPVFDFLMLFYYITFGIAFSFKKTITWK